MSNLPEKTTMSTRAKTFVFPFSPPTPHEIGALVRASDYFLRAATEAETRRIAGFGTTARQMTPDDLPPALAAAGHLCRAVIDVAAMSPHDAGTDSGSA
jgi:hypothetical protein